MSVPVISRLQGFLDSRRMARHPIAVFGKHHSRVGETFVYYFGGVKKVLVTSDPLILRHIFKDNYENYHKSEIQVTRMRHFLGDGLLTSHGDHWHRQRLMIQQGFRKDRLAALTAGMRISLDESLIRFDRAVEAGPVDISAHLMAMTLAMVARSLFSVNFRQGEIELISDAITKIQAFLVRQIVQPYLAPWFFLSGNLGDHERQRREGDNVLMRHIMARRSGPAADDLLQILLDARNSDTGEGMNSRQILSESMQLLVAGHETSSNTLAWILYLLSRHPEYLRRARAEFKSVLGNGDLEYDHLQRLTLNLQIVEESLRLYPAFWMLDRVALREDRIGSTVIAPGTTVIAFIYGVHHSAKYWDQPEMFQPERFGLAARKSQPAFTHLPFGDGPRGCIGSNYAMLQILMILSVILMKYNFKMSSDREVETAPLIILRPKGGIKMEFNRVGEPLWLQR
jgi:cytochrome P450